jgi:hypothetical protein
MYINHKLKLKSTTTLVFMSHSLKYIFINLYRYLLIGGLITCSIALRFKMHSLYYNCYLPCKQCKEQSLATLLLVQHDAAIVRQKFNFSKEASLLTCCFSCTSLALSLLQWPALPDCLRHYILNPFNHCDYSSKTFPWVSGWPFANGIVSLLTFCYCERSCVYLKLIFFVQVLGLEMQGYWNASLAYKVKGPFLREQTIASKMLFHLYLWTQSTSPWGLCGYKWSTGYTWFYSDISIHEYWYWDAYMAGCSGEPSVVQDGEPL